VAAAVDAIRPHKRPAPPPVPAEDVERAVLAAVEDGFIQVSPIRPRQRPANVMSRQIASAAPAAVTSHSGTTGTVASRATQDSVLRLNRVNLIGIFGQVSDRSALVRLPSGRIVKVKIGDRIDGGEVVAITANGLTYSKNGRHISLAMPTG
jgi:type IV pilus biogenesis protein PilP